MKIREKINYLLATAYLYLVSWATAIGQIPEYGESPYSDQKYDPPTNPAWYESPYLWVGVVLALVLVGIILFRRSKRDRYT